MIKIDARGDACPLPVVKAKKAIAELHGPGEVEVLVDNEIAVQNLTKMAQQKGYLSSSEKLAEQEYRVRFTIKDTPAAETAVPGKVKQQAEAETCIPDARTDTVVVIASDKMGEGAEELGKTVILVLHEINYAAFYSDYICAFVDGKIAQFGTVKEVITRENLARIYHVDFEILEIQGKPLSIYY